VTICLSGMCDMTFVIIVVVLFIAILYGYFRLFRQALNFIFDEEERKRTISNWKKRGR
jgi:hypothetical protein